MSGESYVLRTMLELIRIDSESLSERAAADYVTARLREMGVDAVEDEAGKVLGGNAGNLTALVKGSVAGAPTVMLNAHLDTVKPGKGVRPVVEDGVVRASGDTILGSDDKAGVAAILDTVRRLKEEGAPHGDILLVFTVAEELGIKGAAKLDPAVLKADFGYALDSSGGPGEIIVGSPTHDKITAVITGRAAHAGIEPEKGVSAIRVAADAIASMKLGRIDDETTANVGVIRGGLATNIIPESVTIEAEARSRNADKLTEQIANMREALERAASNAAARIDIRIDREYSAYMLGEDCPAVKTAVEAARAAGIAPELRTSGGGSDANVFNHIGLPTATLGIGMRNCHTAKEHIYVSDLEAVARFVYEIVMRAAAGAKEGGA